MSRPYIILKGDCHDELEALVNAYIENGHEPLGGVAVGIGSVDNTCVDLYFQAMLGPPPKPSPEDVARQREEMHKMMYNDPQAPGSGAAGHNAFR